MYESREGRQFPEYYQEIRPEEREELLSVTDRLHRELPDAVLMGGSAMRLSYEAKTGKPMPGIVNKRDSDVYMPREAVDRIVEKPPTGYRVKKEPEWFRPEQGRIALEDTQAHRGYHIDVFRQDAERGFEIIELDGKRAKVLTPVEQMVDRLKLLAERGDQLEPERMDAYRFHVRKLRQLIGEGSGEAMSNAWQRMLERTRKEISEQFDRSIRAADEEGISFEEYVRREAAGRPTEAAQLLEGIPENAKDFEQLLRKQFESLRMEKLAGGWKKLLDQYM